MGNTDQIKSRDNARVSHARKVREGKVADEIFIEGLRLTEEAIRSNIEPKEVFFTDRFAAADRGSSILERLSATNAGVHYVTENVLDSLSDTKTSQGIVLTAARPRTGKDYLDAKGLLVYLHEIADPSNVGAVFRTAEAAGAAGVILSKGSADVFSPKALRSAMGANLRVPIWEKVEWSECVAWARSHGLQLAAADVGGEVPHTSVDWTRPTMLVLGSEAHGLSHEMLASVDTAFRIPMKNNVESLNLAVSAGIVLFEAVRQELNVKP